MSARSLGGCGGQRYNRTTSVGGAGMNIRLALAFSLFCAAQPALSEALTLALKCPGAGRTEESHYEPTYNPGAKGKAKYGGTTATETVGWDGDLLIRIEGSSAKLRLPDRLMDRKEIAEDKWFAFKKLEVTDSTIKGYIKLGLIGGMHVTINRYTSAVRLDTPSSTFDGKCVAYEAGEQKRAF